MALAGGRSGRYQTRNWSRREDSNTPSADYDSAALPLSYTGPRTSKIVPFGSRAQAPCDDVTRQDSENSAVKLHLHTQRSLGVQRYVESRCQNLLESASHLELPERRLLCFRS